MQHQMLATPHRMTPSEFKAHPVRELIMMAAYYGRRGMPSAADIEALPFNQRNRVAVACKHVAKIHGTGFQADAWRRADELAIEIIEMTEDPDDWDDDQMSLDEIKESVDSVPAYWIQ